MSYTSNRQPKSFFSIPNISTTFVATNPVLHVHTKHMEIDYHFIRERVAKSTLVMQFTPFEHQLVDYLTKPLPVQHFGTLRSKLTMLTCPVCLQGDHKQNVSVNE